MEKSTAFLESGSILWILEHLKSVGQQSGVAMPCPAHWPYLTVGHWPAGTGGGEGGGGGGDVLGRHDE